MGPNLVMSEMEFGLIVDAVSVESPTSVTIPIHFVNKKQPLKFSGVRKPHKSDNENCDIFVLNQALRAGTFLL